LNKSLAPFFLLIPLFFGVGYVFWTSDVQNRIISSNFDEIPLGHPIDLKKFEFDEEKPVVLHFYDDACLFSKKNVRHLSKIYSDTRDQVQWVLLSDNISEAKKTLEELNLDISVLSDDGWVIARNLGVLTTPQMVIIKNSRLYFRGNYSKNGAFCGADNISSSDPAVALKSVISRGFLPIYLTKQHSYVGCSL